MVLELEFLAAIIDGAHRRQRQVPAAGRRRGGEDRPRHDTGEKMPGLRHEADPDGEPLVADAIEQRRELAECELGERAGRLQKDFELGCPVAKLSGAGSSGMLR